MSGLQVNDGESLILLGGDITLDRGELNARGGRIELGAVSNGIVNFSADTGSIGLSQNLERADINIQDFSEIDVSGSDNGDINIFAANLTLTSSSRVTAGIRFGLGEVDSQAGNISLDVTDTIIVSDASRISNDVNSFARGKGGNVLINTSILDVSEGSQIGSGVFGSGNAGNVVINAQDSVFFDGSSPSGQVSGAFSTVETNAEGNGGNIEINTDNLSVTNGARLSASTFGTGDAGNVIVGATERIIFDGSSPDGFLSAAGSSVATSNAVGNGGDIEIFTNTLQVTNAHRSKIGAW